MTASEQPKPVFRIIYRSHSRIPVGHRKKVLADIFLHARHRNKDAHITGALLITDHYFAQVLEGDRMTVEQLFDQIRCDPRHEDVTVLESGYVDTEPFPTW
ncbi:Sensors of blue-light using FAD [Pseudonocardia ammonioxydans]|uniref:Sensors of blue-light using FAD n=1 Tax=Pseudonocardia ammonioxydans TaxID=260086 RepID=A0A1I5IP57_PSUAM|nr:BLUF domain-containing protein [Pseudonocardia ammonioxydans]SFO62284.1 Sensors of blue-light using FAD [Pseudonocardia ammonioxydans]